MSKKVKSSKEGTRVWLRPGRKLTVKNDSEIFLNKHRYRVRTGFTIQLEGEAVTVRDKSGALVQPE